MTDPEDFNARYELPSALRDKSREQRNAVIDQCAKVAEKYRAMITVAVEETKKIGDLRITCSATDLIEKAGKGASDVLEQILALKN